MDGYSDSDLYYFKLQLTRANRWLKEIGLIPMLGYVLGLSLFVLLTVFIFNRANGSKYIYSFLALTAVLSLQRSEKITFLRSTYPKQKYLQLRIIENVGVCIPFIIGLCVYGYWLWALALLFLSVLMVFLRFSTYQTKVVPTPFSKNPFEYLVGFRKSWPILPFVFFLILMAIKSNNFNLGLFSLIVLFFTCLSFYGTLEETYFIWIYKHQPDAFLRLKLLEGVKHLFILTLPFSIVLLCYYPDKILTLVIFYVISPFYFALNIVTKYAHYPKYLNIGDVILIVASYIFPPLLIYSLPHYYQKSKQSLKPVLA